MIQIRKYANRKMYNTENAQYIKFNDLINFFKKGKKFSIYDTVNKKDITDLFYKKAVANLDIPVKECLGLIKKYNIKK